MGGISALRHGQKGIRGKRMHELSIMEGVLNMVRENAVESDIGKVNKLKLIIGKMTMLLPDSLQFCFQVLSQDELFSNAVLEIEEKDIVISCNECQQQYILEDGYSFLCPGCGASQVEFISGREMYLDYYEGDPN
jgi:hydrogenase nickel incorporation protein HypA/HybF